MTPTSDPEDLSPEEDPPREDDPDEESDPSLDLPDQTPGGFRISGLEGLARTSKNLQEHLSSLLPRPTDFLPPNLGATAQEAVFRVFADQIQAQQQAISDMLQSVVRESSWATSFASLSDSLFGEFADISKGARRLLEAMAPPNWGDLDHGDVERLIKDTGWPLVWLPSASILEELIAARPDERDSILLAHQEEILEEGRLLVDDLADAELVHLRAPLLEVAGELADGRHRGAQALAAAIFGDLIQAVLAYERFWDAREYFAQDWEEQSIILMRLSLIGGAVTAALDTFWWHRGHPMPIRFNRHASAHYVRDEQYTPTNALVAYMTVVTLAREIQELRNRGFL